jgi:hypothetical protein
MVDSPDWWADKYTDAEWEDRLQRAEEVRALRDEQLAERERRQEVWSELRGSMTTEEADAYIFNLTKLGMSGAEIARSFGLANVSRYVMRHKNRMKGASNGG